MDRVATSTSSAGFAPSTEERELAPRWYKHGEWMFGARPIVLNVVATLVYGAILLAILLSKPFYDELPFHPRMALVLGLAVALLGPSWLWIEGRAFEKWVRGQSETQRRVDRAYFTLMQRYERLFWIVGVLVLFSGFLRAITLHK